MDYKDKPGPGTKLALSWVTEDEQLGPELDGDDDEMGRCWSQTVGAGSRADLYKCSSNFGNLMLFTICDTVW